MTSLFIVFCTPSPCVYGLQSPTQICGAVLVKVVAHHGNIKDGKFGDEFFRKFDLVINALDNLDARARTAPAVPTTVCFSILPAT